MYEACEFRALYKLKCPSIGFAVKQVIDVHTLTFICPHVHAMAGRVYSAEKILQTYIDTNNVHVPLHGKLHNDNSAQP